MPESRPRKKYLLRIIAKVGRFFRYLGVIAFFVAICLAEFNLAGIIGFCVFFASFIFRTNEQGETPMERRSWFEKKCDLDPED